MAALGLGRKVSCRTGEMRQEERKQDHTGGVCKRSRATAIHQAATTSSCVWGHNCHSTTLLVGVHLHSTLSVTGVCSIASTVLLTMVLLASAADLSFSCDFESAKSSDC